ncbi:hypothetical protein [Clostridium transplantifaecale]|uniref:hypothetical protein n=1 Tax=Clostridium transplantifaecale TaxID=2479838 RepID=UPI000F638848|nr:hypothetical protein [Clostridium transplantifaecale]
MSEKEKSIKELTEKFMSTLYELFQSSQGKYTLEMYINLVGEFTDEVIMASKRKGLSFNEGSCFIRDIGTNKDVFTIFLEMYFIDISGKKILEKAEREMEKRKFTYDSIKQIETKRCMEFIIEKPSKG